MQIDQCLIFLQGSAPVTVDSYRFILFSQRLLNSLLFEGFTLRQLLRIIDTRPFPRLCLAVVKRRTGEICSGPEGVVIC
jgi:hypothetical protein